MVAVDVVSSIGEPLGAHNVRRQRDDDFLRSFDRAHGVEVADHDQRAARDRCQLGQEVDSMHDRAGVAEKSEMKMTRESSSGSP